MPTITRHGTKASGGVDITSNLESHFTQMDLQLAHNAKKCKKISVRASRMIIPKLALIVIDLNPMDYNIHFDRKETN